MTHRVSRHVWHTCVIAVKQKVRHSCGMAREDLHFRLRIPEDLKNRVQKAAESNHRSMTAEIVAALEEKYPKPAVEFDAVVLRMFRLLARLPKEKLDFYISEVISEADEESGIEEALLSLNESVWQLRESLGRPLEEVEIDMLVNHIVHGGADPIDYFIAEIQENQLPPQSDKPKPKPKLKRDTDPDD